MNVFQELYDSEINFVVSTLWDGGFDVKLGDEWNGFKAEAKLREWSQVETWLSEKAVEQYPHSEFAMIFRDGLPKAEAQRISREAAGNLEALKRSLASRDEHRP